jgi:DNA-binding transcriptional regulator YiaG
MSLGPIHAREIKAFRRATGMTQAQLASALGASVGAVEAWEGGSRKAHPMLRLALAAINAQLEPWTPPMPDGLRDQIEKALGDE